MIAQSLENAPQAIRHQSKKTALTDERFGSTEAAGNKHAFIELPSSERVHRLAATRTFLLRLDNSVTAQKCFDFVRDQVRHNGDHRLDVIT